MRKYLYLMAGLIYFSTASSAGECIGGKWITANTVADNPNGNCTAATCNGAIFCKSDGTLNWWSAFTWCAGNGLHLATLSEMCPGVPTGENNVEGACPNLQGIESGRIWTALSQDASHAYIIHLPKGAITSSYYSGSNHTKSYQTFNAICR